MVSISRELIVHLKRCEVPLFFVGCERWRHWLRENGHMEWPA